MLKVAVPAVIALMFGAIGGVYKLVNLWVSTLLDSKDKQLAFAINVFEKSTGVQDGLIERLENRLNSITETHNKEIENLKETINEKDRELSNIKD